MRWGVFYHLSDVTQLSPSGFTDCWLLVVTGDVMESDSIGVKVVEDCEAELITLSVVRLGSFGPNIRSIFSNLMLI